FLALIAIFAIFYLVHGYILKENDLFIVALILLIIVTILLIAMMYLLWNKSHNEFIKSELVKDNEKLEIKLEKTNALIDQKLDYLTNMSREIRIPLNAILGMLKMLKKTSLDSDQMAEVEIAQYSSEHLLQLVNMILDNAKFEHENTSLNLVVIDLESDLSKLFNIFKYQAWDRGLEFEYIFLSEKKKKSLLLGDLAKLQQVLVNLINNAIKFTHTGKITVTIHQTVGDDETQIVTFYVKDTGKGLPAHEVDTIVNEFKGDGVFSSDYYRDSSIGLSISYKLVKLMGGQLELESNENEGSVFYFSLQLKKTLNLKVETEKTDVYLLNSFGYKFSILVAEDNKISQKVIKFLLEQQGANCTLVRTGLEAVKLYNILDFDLIFMDIYMPEMDGYEATRTIKATDKYAKAKTPIIAVSASAFDADVDKAILSGVDDFLAKPIETDRLKELLAKYAPQSEN
ncbi:MAG: response regulator, partial [Flavobacteriales bacterium]